MEEIYNNRRLYRGRYSGFSVIQLLWLKEITLKKKKKRSLNRLAQNPLRRVLIKKINKLFRGDAFYLMYSPVIKK